MYKHLAALTLMVNLLVAHSAVAEQAWLYSVRPGDNIWNLCQKYTNKDDCWLKLGDYNGMKLPDQLPPGMIIRFPISWLKSIPTPVTMSFFSGDVTYQTSADTNPESATVGAKLPIGSIVNTGEESIAGLLFGDGSLMQVEPNSSVALDAMSIPSGSGFVDSRIRLQAGAVKTRVPERQPKSRFQITTPAAIAAVRGTEFRVTAYDDDSGTAAMTGEVFEGAVGVAGTAAAKAAKEVQAGFGIKAQKGKELAEPKPLPPTPQWGEVAQLQEPPIMAHWQPVAEATSYRLEVLSAEEDGSAGELLSVIGSPETNFNDDALVFSSGCFVLAIRAIDNEGLMGLANETQVCTREKLATPEMKTRAINFNRDTESLLLEWQPVVGAEGYRVELSTSPEFEQLVTSFDSEQPNMSVAINDALKQGFYYRVQAQGDDVVHSEYSPSREVRRQDEPLKALSAWAVFWVLLVAL